MPLVEQQLRILGVAAVSLVLGPSCHGDLAGVHAYLEVGWPGSFETAWEWPRRSWMTSPYWVLAGLNSARYG